MSDRVIINTVIAKYSDYLPLYRQSAMLERETGLKISRAPLDGWVLPVGELLLPLVGTMGRELLKGSYLQADETPVDADARTGAERTIKRICGSTVSLVAAWWQRGV